MDAKSDFIEELEITSWVIMLYWHDLIKKRMIK